MFLFPRRHAYSIGSLAAIPCPCTEPGRLLGNGERLRGRYLLNTWKGRAGPGSHPGVGCGARRQHQQDRASERASSIASPRPIHQISLLLLCMCVTVEIITRGPGALNIRNPWKCSSPGPASPQIFWTPLRANSLAQTGNGIHVVL